jgi:hypothetical protein
METNEKRQEKVNKTAKTKVNSSINSLSVLSAMCNEVITKRQNPSKLAEVFNICCEVLFATVQK